MTATLLSLDALYNLINLFCNLYTDPLTSLYIDFPMSCSGAVVRHASSRAQEQAGGFDRLPMSTLICLNAMLLVPTPLSAQPHLYSAAE